MSSSEMENSGDDEDSENWGTWVAFNVASAFFASLERFSCVNLDTSYSDDEEDEEANDRPLMLTTFTHDMDTPKSSSPTH